MIQVLASVWILPFCVGGMVLARNTHFDVLFYTQHGEQTVVARMRHPNTGGGNGGVRVSRLKQFAVKAAEERISKPGVDEDDIKWGLKNTKDIPKNEIQTTIEEHVTDIPKKKWDALSSQERTDYQNAALHTWQAEGYYVGIGTWRSMGSTKEIKYLEFPKWTLVDKFKWKDNTLVQLEECNSAESGDSWESESGVSGNSYPECPSIQAALINPIRDFGWIDNPERIAAVNKEHKENYDKAMIAYRSEKAKGAEAEQPKKSVLTAWTNQNALVPAKILAFWWDKS